MSVFFCQGSRFVKDQLHVCRSDVGKRIAHIAETSGNEQWRANYAELMAPSDALSVWQKDPIILISGGRQERNIQRLKDVIIRNNPFDVDVLENKMRDKLINITKNMVIPQDITENTLNAEARGNEAYEEFVNDRIKGQKSMGQNEEGKSTNVDISWKGDKIKTWQTRNCDEEICIDVGSPSCHITIFP